ncbi:MAG: RluA family pseudouridine synthase [Proteobacteria bacterium]|nr:MAG: RluA family pseudouridine synthase [Pseudomonadota bacterium]
MERHSISVSYRLQGMRLDHAIADEIPGFSRRRAKAVIDIGGCYVNTKRVRIASKTVSKGDKIEVEYNPKLFEAKRVEVEILPEDILYFNHGVIVINKPAALPSQATRDQAVHHVVPIVAKTLKAMGHDFKDLQLVHRLDKDTTGCLILATQSSVMAYITEQFKNHEVKKVYHAVTWGIGEPEFEERCNLSAIQGTMGKVRVLQSGGKSSHTYFKTLETFPASRMSLMEARPVTGRSHQIRIHLENNNLPIFGDRVYGEGKRHKISDALLQKVQYQLLHSHSISFSPAPGVDVMTVTAPYRENFADVLAELRNPA